MQLIHVMNQSSMFHKEYQGTHHLPTIPLNARKGFEPVTSTLIPIITLVIVVALKDPSVNVRYNCQIYTRSLGSG